jgi:TatD DNase family protein
LRDVAVWAPLDRLLVETDAPYLAPQPVRGKPNQPRNAGLTARVLAELRGLPLPEFLEVTAQNFERLVGIPRPPVTGRG